jgi:hypothetical protein
MVESRIERGDKIETERRSYISSRALSATVFADAARSHWAIENNLHWTLEVTFNEDQSRLRIGHGAKNMAVIRQFALNLVRQVADKQSIKLRRKRANWDPKYLLEIKVPAGDIGPKTMLTSTRCPEGGPAACCGGSQSPLPRASTTAASRGRGEDDQRPLFLILAAIGRRAV